MFKNYFEPQHILYIGKILHHTTNQKCYQLVLTKYSIFVISIQCLNLFILIQCQMCAFLDDKGILLQIFIRDQNSRY